MYKIGFGFEFGWGTRAGAGGAVVVGSNPAQSMNFSFFPLSKNS